MFFIFSKLLIFLLRPTTWIATLLVYSWYSGIPKRKGRSLAVALLLFFFFSNAALLNVVVKAWEPETITADQIKRPYPVGILLGGFSNLNITPAHDRYNLSETGNRLVNTLELYHKGKIKKILITGGQGSLTQEHPAEAQAVRPFLETMGVRAEDILLEPRSRNTHENALFSKQLIDSLSIEGPFLLLTSAWHLPRARRCFEKAGMEATPFGVDYMSEGGRISPEKLIVPDAGALHRWERLLKEWIGLLAYRLKGYI
ncbi:YdcF family protein [Phaeodactylibacter luteus]|uniref:YdcF family protein n=1 Tax=Phaeodactylibacter luteus TaxID=1564516 RepID=A0A5C6S394_9BACT|nr:YdcF family protein [Phaeodactylibacter luteus]TXB68892.1 YdcF family protein [Phaeodactylibacter luteus]